MHAAGRDFQIGVLTGASTGPSLDDALAKASAVPFRTPYQSDLGLRAQINAGTIRFVDMHLSLLPHLVRNGFLGPVHWAVVEACDVTAGGGMVLSTSAGCHADSPESGQQGADRAQIGQNVADFLAGDMLTGRILRGFLPLQSGCRRRRELACWQHSESSR
jgi:acyl-CoA hydrolase